MWVPFSTMALLSPFGACTRWQVSASGPLHGRPSWGMSISATEATVRLCLRESTIHFKDDNPLAEFIQRHSRLFVLTGAGCSTDSGIPDYRDENGDWKRARPVMFQAFV